MLEVNRRIRERRLAKGMTLLELANKIGVREATVQRYESGAIKNIKYNTLIKIAKALDCKPEYLMSWSDKPDVISNDSKHKKNSIRIPVYGNIAAGVPIEEIEDVEDWEDYEIKGNNGHDYIALRIKGDSMSPRICNGDVIIIRLQSTIENGELAAVRVNDGFTDSVDATCKRVKYTDDGGIMLVSLNPEFPPMYYSRKDIIDKNVEIIGKVVELRGKL